MAPAAVCEYACEWWGFQEKNDIELLHRKFCKMVLNVPQMSRCMVNLAGCLCFTQRSFNDKVLASTNLMF